MAEYNFSNEETYDLVKAGDYEVILTAEFKTPKNGGERYISCSFKIRDDVEQEEKKRVVFDKIYKDKENPTQFDHRKLQKLLLTQGKDGVYTFSSDEALVQHINGMAMRITVEIEGANQWHDDQKNVVKYCSYKPSQAKPQELPSSNGGVVETKNTSNIDVNDEDLPF